MSQSPPSNSPTASCHHIACPFQRVKTDLRRIGSFCDTHTCPTCAGYKQHDKDLCKSCEAQLRAEEEKEREEKARAKEEEDRMRQRVEEMNRRQESCCVIL